MWHAARGVIVLCCSSFSMDKLQAEVDKIMAGGGGGATIMTINACKPYLAANTFSACNPARVLSSGVTSGMGCVVWHAATGVMVLCCSSFSMDKLQPEVDKIMAGGVAAAFE
jgi:hypothetical protein